MNKEKLYAILKNHMHWLREDCEGWEEMRADLSGADLSGAYLRGADLRGADLRGAENIPFIPMTCPDTGSFIGWKKVFGRGFSAIIKLRIPEEAKRCSATGRKCRCEFAEVLEIENLLTGERMDYIENFAYAPVTYITGRIVYPDSFDENRWNECSHGIHFFINRQEAVDYQ